MPLNRFWSQPNSNFTSTSANGVVIDTAQTNQPGWSLAADYVSTPTLTTAPPNAASVSNVYTAQTASVATVVQNTLGYDAQFTAYFTGAASVATFLVGVGSTSTPPVIAVASSINTNSASAIELFPFSAYVPSGYYFSFQVSQANAASVPSAALTIVANPV